MNRKGQAAAMREAGATNHQITTALGINAGTMWKWFGPSPNGRNARRNYETRDQLERRATDLEWEGHSFREIAAELGVPRSTVHDWLRRAA